MDRAELESLLRDVAAGGVAVEAAVETLAEGPMAGQLDLGFARVDTHRGLRTGDPEVVYAAGKTPDQTVAILRALAAQDGGRPALATRLPDEPLAAVRAAFPDALVDEVARAVAVGPLPRAPGTVCVVAAGTSDAPVAAEAAFVARAFGAGVDAGRRRRRGRHPPAARGARPASTRPTASSWSPAWRARCPAWSAG